MVIIIIIFSYGGLVLISVLNFGSAGEYTAKTM